MFFVTIFTIYCLYVTIYLYLFTLNYLFYVFIYVTIFNKIY